MAVDFLGRGEALSDGGIAEVGKKLGIGLPEVWSVLQVETSGSGFFADRRPKILFERHIFSAQTGGKFDAQHPDISNQKRGGYKGGPAEYDRLAQAITLDRTAALKSASWGIGQVMGFNAESVGFPDVDTMVKAMTVSESEQLGAMAEFVTHNKLDTALRNHDWAGFAEGYNGSSFAENEYDKKLKAAFDKLAAGPLPDLKIRTAQLYLTYRGINPHGIDGLKGKNTTNAIKAFQTGAGLPATGELDDTTMAKLAEVLGPA